MRIGIAGGIGSGKSYVCERIRQRGFEVYDCDSAAKRLIRTDPDIRQQLTALIGPDTYTPEGQLNKAVVARFLLASDANADAISILPCSTTSKPAVCSGSKVPSCTSQASPASWIVSSLSQPPWRYVSGASWTAITSPAPKYSPG